MNMQDTTASGERLLVKSDPAAPALVVTGREAISIRAGVTFAGRMFGEDTPVASPDGGYEVGDYAVTVGDDGAPRAVRLTSIPADPAILGGFHFAPGGNAPARSGGDGVPAINPFSCWDHAFRPSCPDPRGMTLVEMAGGERFWCDIYLTGADHLDNGTSAFGVTIADGGSLPQKLDGKGRFKKFDYETARAVVAHHGKGLLSVEESFAAYHGVTEKTAHDDDPVTTQLDAARTSKWGVMQATGNLWVWGHDGDPDNPRASLFGGSRIDGGYAGSRCADVACIWPANSVDLFGARGRSDHLQLG